MDENTIFKPQPGIGTEGLQREVPVQNPITPPPPTQLPSAPAPSSLFKVLKVILGITAVFIILLIIVNVILPKFFKKSITTTTLAYWGLWEDPSVVAPIISDFEKDNPGIKISYSKQDIKDYRERLITRVNNGNGPDIFRFHNSWNSWIPQLSDLLLPLPNSTIPKEEFTKDYYPVAKSDLIRNGAIYGVPLQIDTLNLYINQELFQAAGLKTPTNWIEFGEDARQLTVKDENNNIKTSGAAMGAFDNITHAPDIISMLFAQNGTNLRDISKTPKEANDALNFYTSFATSPSNVWGSNLDSSIRMFAAGSLAMYFGYSWDFFTIKSLNPNLSFNIVSVPNLPGQSATVASYWAEGVSSKSRHQKEALLFIKFLARKETQEKLFTEESKTRNFGEPYSRVDLADNLKNSVIYPFVANAPNAVSSFFVDGTYDNGLNSQMNKYLGNAINSILKGASAESAADTLGKDVTQALKQYGQ